MGNEQKMCTNQPTLSRLNKSYNFGCENTTSSTENYKKKKKHWIRNVHPLGTNRPDFGYETSKPLGTNRPTWVRIVLDTKRPGYETSIILANYVDECWHRTYI